MNRCQRFLGGASRRFIELLDHKQMEYSLNRPRFQVYSTEAMLEELRRVANHYNNRRFSRREYDAVASSCKGSAILARFGGWNAALKAAGLELKVEGRNRWAISDQQLFEEMGRVWGEIGHRPSHDEWVGQKAKYSYTTYKARFNGWMNACTAFVAYVTGRRTDSTPKSAVDSKSPMPRPQPHTRVTNPEKRNVSEKLRYRVLARDHFKCVLCGRTPANESAIKLHIDHKVPFSRGGRTVFENLQSVCNQCNWGKGSDIQDVAGLGDAADKSP